MKLPPLFKLTGSVALILGSSMPATAQVIDWSATGTSISWTLPANWVGGVVPANDITTNIARFNQTSYAFQPTVSGTRSIAGLQFGDGITLTAPITLTGNTTPFLHIGASGIVVAPNSGTVSFNSALPIRLAADQSWTNNSSSLLTISGTVSNTADVSPFTLTFNGSGTGGTTIGGVISNGGTTGTTALVVNTTGGGKTTLTGGNTFTGGATLTQGILRGQGSSSLGAGTLTLAGGELQLANNTGANFGRNTTITGNTLITSDRIAAGAGTTHILGTLSIGENTLAVASGENATSGTAGVTFGATTLTGNATFNVVDGGTTASRLTLGAISGSNSITKTGTGTLTASALSSAYTGEILINEGTVSATATGGLGTGQITLGSDSAAANLTLSTTGSVSISNNLTVAAGGSRVLSLVGTGTTGGVTYAGNILLNEDLLVTSNNTITNGSSSLSGNVSGSANLTLGNTANRSFTASGGLNNNGQVIADVDSGGISISGTIGANVQKIVKTGASTLTISGANNQAFGRKVEVLEGTLAVGADKSLNNSNIELEITSSALVDVSPGAAGTRRTIGGLTGSGTVTNSNTGSNRAATLALNAVEDYVFDGSITQAGANGIGIVKSGVGTQTFTNTSASTSSVRSSGGGVLKLSGSNATMASASGLTLQNGTLELDNTGANNSNRISDTATVAMANGKFTLKGNATDATTENIGALTVNAGGSTITVDASGNSAGAELIFASFARGSGTAAQINFVGEGGTLGTAGANPRIKFNTAPALTNGVIANTAASTTLGFATVNGTDFAGYDATNGVVAVSTTDVSGALVAAATQNSRLNASGTIANTHVTYNTLKIEAGAGDSLTLNGTGNLSTNAILLAGPNDFTIQNGVGGTGRISGASAQRNFYVGNASTTLNIGVSLAGTPQQVVKAGDGFMALTGNSNLLNFTSAQSISIGGGTLRGTLAALGGGTSAGGAFTRIDFRGGVLELDGGGTFSRAIDLAGTAAGGGVGWEGTVDTDAGSGGFSAINGDTDVTLVDTVGGSTAATLVWNDGKFVSDGNSLIFGSTKANSQITLTNNIGLDNGTPGNAYGREIRVLNNTSSSTDIARLSGVISGSVASDLVKTGTGTLLLTGANTYQGRTHVKAGTLAIGSTGSIANTPIIRISQGATFDASAVSGSFILGSGQKLENKGTFVGNLTVSSGATFSPGNSPGIATQEGTLNLATGSNFEWELVANSTSGAGTSFDQTVFNTGGLTIQSGVTADLVFDLDESSVDWNSTFWDSNRSWLVFDGASSLSVTGGIFSTVNVSSDSLGQSFSITGGAFSFSSSGNDIFLNYTVVPEPSSYALLILGAASALVFRRKRA